MSETRPKASSIQIQSLARACEILKCFEKDSELSLSELSNELSLNKSTVYGLTNTLRTYNMLEQNPDNKKYRLGIKLFEYGNLVRKRMDSRSEAHSFSAFLAEKYPATVHIATYSEGEIIYIDKIANSNHSIVYSEIGKRAPMYCTGVGKALLANLPIEYAEKYVFSKPMPKFTENTIADREALLSELHKIRLSGIAFDNEELELGISCIAAPVFDYSYQPVLGISVSFLYGRSKNIDMEQLKDDLLRCTRQLSERLGLKFI